MKILSCNIRCYGAEDGKNNWVNRKDLCVAVIEAQAPDVICFQEMWAEQFADISSSLTGFDWHAMVDEPVGRRPMNCIFYRPDRYRRISAGGFWLSETPHIAGSMSWDSACVRLANWIRLESRETGAEFRVVNTHLDHVSQVAREHQAKLIVEDAVAYPEAYAQVLAGDMNCDMANRAIETFKAGRWVDTYGTVHGAEDPGYTFHQFMGPEYSSAIGKMDWIFSRGQVKVIDAAVITDSLGGRFPSDHYFVSATLEVREPGNVGEHEYPGDA